MKLTSSQQKGIFYLLTSAFLYSLMPVLIRLLGSNGIPPISQVSLRYFVAFLAAVVYFFVISKKKFVSPKTQIPLLLFACIFGYGLTNVFFTIGILNTQVSNTLFLFYTFAIIAPILGFIFLKDKLNKFNIISLTLSLLALLLLFQPTSFASWKIGGLFAFLSGITQATYLIARKKLQEYPAHFMMLMNTFLGAVFVGLIAFIVEHSFFFDGAITQVSTSTWIATILFGIDNFLAWLTMTKGFEYFKATSGSVILLSEIVFGLLFALVFFQEIPTIATVIGGVLILFASVLVILKGES